MKGGKGVKGGKGAKGGKGEKGVKGAKGGNVLRRRYCFGIWGLGFGI